MNNDQGGLSFDSGGVISLHDDLNTNGYSIVGKNGGGIEIKDDSSTRLHGTLDLNGSRIDGVFNFAAGELVFAKNINMNENSIRNSYNLQYTINGTYDKNNINEINKKVYVTFDKLSYFFFTSSCVLKDYIFIVEKTEQTNMMHTKLYSS